MPDDASLCPSCGSAEPTVIMPDEPVPPGRRPVTGVQPRYPSLRVLAPGVAIGPYALGRRLGEGGMSVVYAATDTQLDRDVAVKVLHVNLLGDQGIRRRFLREGRICRGWSHPNVVPVLDVVEVDELVALVMERVDAPTLADLVASYRGPMPLEEVGQIADGLLAGLEAAHARNVVHRDLKPGNVLVPTVDGRLHPRIIDFGIARVLEGTTYTLTGAVLGTCRYMSPEQVRGEAIDPRADLYALGVVLFELLTGRPPFEDEQPFALMMAHTSQPPPPLRSLRPELSEALERFVLDLLAKRPDDRPPSAARARARLRELVDVDAGAPVVPVGPVRNGHELLLVEAGPFAMGPERRSVWLDAFSIDRFPVTNAQYQVFLRATGYVPDDPASFLHHWPDPTGPAGEQRDHPVVYVSHADVTAYAGWLGLRLPTEAEWEKAARGTDARRYPWGQTSPTPDLARYGRQGTDPVGARPLGASPCGAQDMVGNVGEWTGDEDDPDFLRNGPTLNPRRPVHAASTSAATRGAGWLFDDPRSLLVTARAAWPVHSRLAHIGFRLAGG
ncbi:MAG: SUMF1/EgtB/PvdO family nonheme iron enzyme [Myxococcales bacterium]|nr:SUMF1/EgtB/PvdO family nonheme iron enzyme [Myxococcales bacterium]